MDITDFIARKHKGIIFKKHGTANAKKIPHQKGPQCASVYKRKLHIRMHICIYTIYVHRISNYGI